MISIVSVHESKNVHIKKYLNYNHVDFLFYWSQEQKIIIGLNIGTMPIFSYAQSEPGT